MEQHKDHTTDQMVDVVTKNTDLDAQELEGIAGGRLRPGTIYMVKAKGGTAQFYDYNTALTYAKKNGGTVQTIYAPLSVR